MKNLKRLTIWTIILNFFIVIGAGHGIAPIGLFEIAALFHGFEVMDGLFSLSLTNSYDKSIAAAALFSLIGQSLLVISIFSNKYQRIVWLKNAGLAFLWIGFYYLTHNLFSDNISVFSFAFGIPFLIISGVLFYRIIQYWMHLSLE